MPEPKEYSELTRAATDGEGLSTAVLERIERAIDKGRAEGRRAGLQEAATEARSEAIYLRKYRDDHHQADGAAKVLHRIEKLLEGA